MRKFALWVLRLLYLALVWVEHFTARLAVKILIDIIPIFMPFFSPVLRLIVTVLLSIARIAGPCAAALNMKYHFSEEQEEIYEDSELPYEDGHDEDEEDHDTVNNDFTNEEIKDTTCANDPG